MLASMRSRAAQHHPSSPAGTNFLYRLRGVLASGTPRPGLGLETLVVPAVIGAHHHPSRSPEYPGVPRHGSVGRIRGRSVPSAVPRALKSSWSEGFLCVSSRKAEGSSSHGWLLVAGRGGGRGPGGGHVDQSSIRAKSPMVSCGWAAQASGRPLHHKAMTPTERARTRPPTSGLGRIGTAAAVVAGRPSTG